MRYTYHETGCDWQDCTVLAQACEEIGFTSFALSDSTVFPRTTDSIWPYEDVEGVRAYIESTPIVEPMVGFAWLAALTKTIRFYPNVIKMPTHSPVLLAKQISSLAVISNNRFTLGAGLGPWQEDYTNAGVDWTRRGQLLDECIEIVSRFMTGEYFEYHSENYDIVLSKMNPVPTKPVPIILGGHAKPALRRAAKLCDGWISLTFTLEECKPYIEEINRLRDEYGTGNKPYEFHVGATVDLTPDGVSRLAEIGVTDVYILPFHGRSGVPLQEKLDVLRRFGDQVIAR